jgi:NAD(P)-dependent dehydrogenase (short-subunit alcohol dehydrogenase family)
VKTIVISGATDGMGKALARTYLDRGDTVVAIGRNPEKALAGAHFVHADLSLITETRKAIDEIRAAHPVIDALVLCARHFRTARLETSEGFESTFALEYLSRYLLSHGLLESLERAPDPLIINVSGPGASKPEIQWEDPNFVRNYSGVTAQMHAGRANDLLGMAFTAPRTKYVLLHPGLVATGFSGTYDAETAAHIEGMKKAARPVEEGIAPIIALLDGPPTDRLSAYMRHKRIALPYEEAAERLRTLTEQLLAD